MPRTIGEAEIMIRRPSLGMVLCLLLTISLWRSMYLWMTHDHGEWLRKEVPLRSFGRRTQFVGENGSWTCLGDCLQFQVIDKVGGGMTIGFVGIGGDRDPYPLPEATGHQLEGFCEHGGQIRNVDFGWFGSLESRILVLAYDNRGQDAVLGAGFVAAIPGTHRQSDEPAYVVTDILGNIGALASDFH